MRDFFNKLKIPTLLGLSIIVVGIVTGVFLTLRGQTFTSKASPSISPQNLTLSNVSDTEVTISWQTSNPTPAFITYGQSDPSELTALDDRDTKTPTSYSTHHITIKNLLPKTTYQYKIVSGKIASDVKQFTTTAPINQQTGFTPITGLVVDGGKPLEEGIVYLSINEAAVQSGVVKSLGNFLIPISQIRNADLSANFPLTEDIVAKLTIVSPKGEATALFSLRDSQTSLPPIALGEDLDLTVLAPPLVSYDLNSDGIINASDHSAIQNIILEDTGKDPKNRKADLNNDRIVDQRDLDLMLQKLRDLTTQ